MNDSIIRPASETMADRERLVTEAAHLLAAGRLVVLPTETVYGLAADATNHDAVAQIFAAKNRPQFNPLIAHVGDRAMAKAYGYFDRVAAVLADRFWPGPLTLVLPRRQAAHVSPGVTAGLPTIALRLPGDFFMHAVAARLGRPLAAPSANRSGRVSPTTAQAAAEELGAHVAMIVDTGRCTVGVESTIVAVDDGKVRLLRPGGVSRAQIEAATGQPVELGETDAQQPSAPGMLASHYAPEAIVRLEATSVAPGDALLAFGAVPAAGQEQARTVLNLSEKGDLAEAAANLFAHLRTLDASGARTIAVMPIPERGLGEAINDRLRRAAAPRG